MFRFILTGLAALAAPLCLSAALGVGSMTLAVSPAVAQQLPRQSNALVPGRTGSSNA